MRSSDAKYDKKYGDVLQRKQRRALTSAMSTEGAAKVDEAGQFSQPSYRRKRSKQRYETRTSQSFRPRITRYQIEIARRRFARSRTNFTEHYGPLADRFWVFDVNGPEPILVARKR